MKAFILTESYNDYDQHGAYFIAWWPNKPTMEELRKVITGYGDTGLQHVLDGGGRRNFEDSWYDLEEVEAGVDYSD